MTRKLTMVLLAAALVLAVVWVMQRRLIYLPSGIVPDSSTIDGVEEVSYRTADDLTLAAWFVPAVGDSAGTVIVFAGNAGNRSHRLPLARALADAGYGTLLVDYRGYGGNPGSPSEEGLIQDGRAALRSLRSRPDVDPHRIAYLGESLGSGVAVSLAAESPPAALVLRSPFTSLADVGSEHYPFLPVGLLLRDRFDNLATVSRVDAPILVIAGSDDRIVPPHLSRRLHEAAADRSKFVLIEGADHNDPSLLAGDETIAVIVEFLNIELSGRSG